MKIDCKGSGVKVLKEGQNFLIRVYIPYTALELLVPKWFIAAIQSKDEIKDSSKLMRNLGIVATDDGGWPNVRILGHVNYL